MAARGSLMEAVRKAAILLLSLEKPIAAEVLSQLPKGMVEQVTLEIAQIDDITKDQVEAVLREFRGLARERVPIERGGIDFANDLLKQSLGTEGAGEILENVRNSMNSVPFGFLHKMGAENILTFIIEEHPQTIALIMSHLPTNIAAEVLSGLPSNKQIEVIRRVANMEQTNPEVVKDVEASLERRMKSMFNQQLEKAGGVRLVAQILNVTDRMTNKGVLENLEQEDADLVGEIKRLMFVFDDLLKLDDKAIQAELKEKILGNLSERAAELLKEEMQYAGPQRVSDVEAMQAQIVEVVRRLEDSGQIVVASGDQEEFIS